MVKKLETFYVIVVLAETLYNTEKWRTLGEMKGQGMRA